MLQVGSTVDGWNIDAVIHQGSMAVTYAVGSLVGINVG